jgi:hypothetical protein
MLLGTRNCAVAEKLSTRILTWGEAESENVATEITKDEKTFTTAMAAITAECAKLPPYFITKRKTSKVDISQKRKIVTHEANHCPNGWKTVDMMKRSLQWPRRTVRKAGTINNIHLTVDMYRAHCRRCEESGSLTRHCPAFDTSGIH